MLLKLNYNNHESQPDSYNLDSIKNLNNSLGHWFLDYLDFTDQKKSFYLRIDAE